MGLFFKSRKRSSGGGILTLIVIIGALYFTGLLPKAWSYTKSAMTSGCSAVVNSAGVGGQGVCSAIGSFFAMIDNALNSVTGDVGGMVSDAGQQFDEQWAGSQTRMDLQEITREVDGAMSALGKSGLTSGQDTLNALMRTGPAGMSVGGGDTGMFKGAMDSFAISQQLMRSQPALSMEWMQKGATMGAYGMPSQLSLGNVYAQSGQNAAAASYYGQALQSLNALQNSNSPAAAQMLQGMNVSPQQLQAQITAAIRQMQPGAK